MNQFAFARRHAVRKFAPLVVLLYACSPVHAKVKRHDTVVMKNGDRITGEVKRLQKGVLSVQTDYISGSVGLDWMQVESIQSTATFQVVLDNGRHIIGLIEKVSDQNAPGGNFTIRQPQGEQHADARDVVNIESQKASFWRQLRGSIDLGYGYTSGNSQHQANASTNIGYLTTRWSVDTSTDSSVSGQPGATHTNTQEATISLTLFLNRNSFLVNLSDFLHSTQQDLDLRSTVGGAYGRYFVRGNRSNLRWFVGAVYTNEKFTLAVSQPRQENIEALLGEQYSLFSFDRAQLQSQLLVFPGLTDTGRVRLTTNTNLKIKLPNNFYYNLTLWDNFDSRPPGNAKRNELGVSTGIGWSF